MPIRLFFLALALLALAACNLGATPAPPLPTNTPLPTFTPTVEVVIAPVDPGAAAAAKAAEEQATATALAAAAPQPAATQPPSQEQPTATDTPAPAAPAEAAVTASSAMNVRSGPGTNYGVIGSANAGQRFLVTGKNPAGDWWQINFNGQAGWVFGQLVSQENTGGVQVAANIPAAPPPPTNPPPPPPTNTPVPAAPAPAPAPAPAANFPFLLSDNGRCDPNAGTTYFSGFARYPDGSLQNGVCVHVAFFGPRNTKCSGCGGVGDGYWSFSPFGGPAPAGTTVEIFVVQCPGTLDGGGQSDNFGDLTPQSPKWVKTFNQSEQCTGITFTSR